MHDPLGAFCLDDPISLPGSGKGPLLGLNFAAKDSMDIAGRITGNGHPLWRETHEPAKRTASCVQKLLDAGARLVGTTQCDELCYSLNGENIHYGTPINPAAPGRIPGGSSSGAVAAVAGELVDFALGTDCGGSVRLPASYCGVYGIRTTHGLVPADGIIPLAGSFDTVGWFARDAAMMTRVGDVLLPKAPPFMPKRLLVATDTFAAVGPEVTAALAGGAARVRGALPQTQDVTVYTGDPAAWSGLFRILQGGEIRTNHTAWLERYKPSFGPGVAERFAWVRTIDPAEVEKARPGREAVTAHIERLIGDDGLLCFPSAPGIAPKLNTPAPELEVFRARAFALLAIAGLAGLPQLSLPLGTLDGCPLGLSLVAPRGCDRGLLAFAERLMA